MPEIGKDSDCPTCGTKIACPLTSGTEVRTKAETMGRRGLFVTWCQNGHARALDAYPSVPRVYMVPSLDKEKS